MIERIKNFCNLLKEQTKDSYSFIVFWSFPEYIREIFIKYSRYGRGNDTGNKNMIDNIIKFSQDDSVSEMKSVLPQKYKSDTYDLLLGNFNFTPSMKKYLTGLELIERPEIVLFGKIVRQKRDVKFFSDTSEGYRYSNKLSPSYPMTPYLDSIINRINHHFSTKYNGILINRYNDGKEYIGAHSDDESGLGEQGVISISVGATRKFRIRYKTPGKKSNPIILDVPVKDGEILIMYGDFQKYFTHEIPVETKIRTARTSLTFRNHKK